MEKVVSFHGRVKRDMKDGRIHGSIGRVCVTITNRVIQTEPARIGDVFGVANRIGLANQQILHATRQGTASTGRCVCLCNQRTICGSLLD
jgi:hypothetical protein